MNLRCVWGYMQGMVLPHKIYLCDELYGNIEVQENMCSYFQGKTYIYLNLHKKF